MSSFVLLIIIVFTTSIIVSCQRDRSQLLDMEPLEPIAFIFDQGSSAPDAPESGLSFAIWADGAYVITADFPASTARLDSGIKGTVDPTELSKVVAEAIEVCGQQSLATAGARYLIVGYRDEGMLRSMLVPDFVLSPDSGLDTHCIRSIRSVIESIRNCARGQDGCLPEDLKSRVLFWFDENRRALIRNATGQ